MMDYIREFDIRPDREMYYAGEVISGIVMLDTLENFKLRCIRIFVRGKAHVEWKVMVAGDRKNFEEDQYFFDEREILFGKDKCDGSVPILPRGVHQYPFRFQLPETSLPCSFESKPGWIRYYIKVILDVPYASPPQGVKYFTIIGPHIDCMEEQYLKPMVGQDKKTTCCLCCKKGPIALKSQLERSAYVCGEALKLKANIDNQGEENVRLKVKLLQHVEYVIPRSVLGLTKELSHLVFELTGDWVKPHTQTKWDSSDSLVLPVMPPSTLGSCRLIHVYYVLRVSLEFDKKGDELQMHFPITIATVPFRIPNSNTQPNIYYDVAVEHVEGGIYIGPEFLLGQVYDGDNPETVVIYRPVYVAVKKTPANHNTTATSTTEMASNFSKNTSVAKPASSSITRLNSL